MTHKKPVYAGCGPLLNDRGETVHATREQAQRLADKQAARSDLRRVKGCAGFVFDAGHYYRINVGAKMSIKGDPA